MTSALVVPSSLAILTVLVVAGLAVAVVALGQALRRTREQSDEVLLSAATDAEALRQELDGLEARLREQAELVARAEREARLASVTVVDDREYVITELGERKARKAGTMASGPLAAVPTVPTPVFVDIVLRESLIRTASLAAGLKRALAPEVRNRVRFEMRREVKRSRKQRRLALRQSRRDLHASQRAEAT
jgi:hypothetical protein